MYLRNKKLGIICILGYWNKYVVLGWDCMRSMFSQSSTQTTSITLFFIHSIAFHLFDKNSKYIYFNIFVLKFKFNCFNFN